MADENGAITDLLPALSPLDDPDAALLDRKGAMAKLFGSDDATPSAQPPQPNVQVAQNDPPPRLSPNGNPLPDGLQSRVSSPAPTASPAVPPVATVPGSVTPSGSTGAPSLADRNAATVGQMQDDYTRASQDVQNEAKQPDLAAVTKGLEAQRQNAAQGVNAYDPRTGKLWDEYKPSFGQRLVRGVEGFARGGVFGVLDPKLAGAQPYGAPNAEYQREAQQKRNQVVSLDQQLKQAADNYKSTSDRLAKVASDRRALATTGKDVTGASIAQQTIPIDQQKADTGTQEAQNNSPEAKQQVLENQYQQLQNKADDLKLTGQQRTLFLANGKLPDPRQATAEEIARAQATAAWHRDNPGKQPTLDDIRTINAAVGGSEIKGNAAGKPFPPALAARISQSKSAAMKSAQAKLSAGMDPKTGEKYEKSDFVNDMNQAQDAYEQAIEAAGGSVNHMTMGDDMSWKAAEPTHAVPATSRAATTPHPNNSQAARQPAATPPAALLSKTPEGGTIYGRGGESFKKQGGKWVAQ